MTTTTSSLAKQPSSTPSSSSSSRQPPAQPPRTHSSNSPHSRRIHLPQRPQGGGITRGFSPQSVQQVEPDNQQLARRYTKQIILHATDNIPSQHPVNSPQTASRAGGPQGVYLHNPSNTSNPITEGRRSLTPRRSNTSASFRNRPHLNRRMAAHSGQVPISGRYSMAAAPYSAPP
jgi:hypothetical protein